MASVRSILNIQSLNELTYEKPPSQCRMPPVTDPNGPVALNPLLVALLRSNMFAHTRANGHERIQIVIVHEAHSCSSEKHLKSSLSLQCLTNQGLPFLANEIEPQPV